MLGFGVGISHCGIVGGVSDAPDFAASAAKALLSGETQGLAFSFADDQSAYILDTGTPANDYDSTGIVSSGSLVGPSGKLTYTSPSNKLTLQSDGYYKYQAHNLVLQSAFPGAVAGTPGTAPTSWVLSSGGGSIDSVVDDGTGNNDVTLSVSASRQFFSQGFTFVTGAEYRIAVYGTFDGNVFALNLLSLGTVSVSSQYYFNGVAVAGGSYFPSGTGLLESVFTVTSGTSGTIRWGLGTNSNTTGTATFSKYIVQRYPANTDYIKTTTAAKYALPLEYSATDGSCLGLPVEEQRTNLVTYSSQFDNAAWGNGESAVTANQAVAPDGTTTADLIADDGLGGTAAPYVTQTITVSTATTYTGSVYAKSGSETWLGLSTFGFTTPADGTTYFDLSSGSIGTTATGHTARITDVGNGWYRCSITFTTDASDTTGAFRPSIAEGDGDSTFGTADGSHTLYMWGAQFEAGSFPTSPILTYGAAATRNADPLSQLSTTFPLSATAGSLYAYVAPYAGADLAGIVSLNDGTGNEEIVIYKDASANIVAQVEDGGVGQLAPLDSTVNASSGTAFKVALAWAANDFALSADGTAAQTDTGGTLPTVTTLEIGVDQANNYFNGHIKAISYVPRRKSDAELQTETA